MILLPKWKKSFLKQTVLSTKGLTERRAKYRPLIMDRNVCIINLVVNYGLSLQELVSLNMSHIKFAGNILMVPGENGTTRPVSFTMEDTQQLYKYYTTIPEPVRPRQHTDNPPFLWHLILIEVRIDGFTKRMHQRLCLKLLYKR